MGRDYGPHIPTFNCGDLYRHSLHEFKYPILPMLLTSPERKTLPYTDSDSVMAHTLFCQQSNVAISGR